MKIEETDTVGLRNLNLVPQIESVTYPTEVGLSFEN